MKGRSECEVKYVGANVATSEWRSRESDLTDDGMSDPVGMTAGRLPPAAPAQARIWHLDARRPGRPDNTVAIRWLLEGEVAAEAVEDAIRAVIQRHEILRTRLVARDGVPAQDILDHVAFKLNHVNIRALPIDDHEPRIEAIAREMAAEPFDLSAPPLLRVTLVRTTPQTASLLIAVHRCVFDDPSIDVLGHEIGTLAAAAMIGGAADLPELPLHYGEYALWQEECAARPARADARAFWAATLAGVRHFDVPGDAGRGDGTPARLCLPLPPGFARRLGAAARARGASPFTMATAAVSAALARLVPGPEVVLSTSPSGRDAPDLEPLIGPFANPVMLRLPVEASASLATHLDRLRPRVSDALAHRSCTLAEVTKAVPPPPAPEGLDARDVPYSSVAFGMTAARATEQDYGSFRLIPEPAHRPGLLHPLAFEVLGHPSGWELRIDYDRGRYSEARIGALGSVALAAFERLIEAPDTPLSALPDLDAPAEAQPDPGAPVARIRDANADRLRPEVPARPGPEAPARHRPEAPARHTPEAAPTWEIRSLRPGTPGGPVVVTVNRPTLYERLATRFAADRTIVNITAPDRAARERQAARGPEAVLAEATDLIARAFAGRPLAFAGHGPDAITSLHLARRLDARGFAILCCALGDALAPPWPGPAVPPALRRWQDLIGEALRGRGSRGALGTRSRIGRRLLGALGAAPPEADVDLLYRSIVQPAPFAPWDGEVLFFASDDAPPQALRQECDWSGLLAPDTAIFHVPGRLERALLGPEHRRIAEIFDMRIARRMEALTE